MWNHRSHGFPIDKAELTSIFPDFVLEIDDFLVIDLTLPDAPFFLGDVFVSEECYEI